MYKLRWWSYFLLVAIILLSGCNTTKFVPQGKYLLDKVTIKNDTKEIPKDILRDYLRQTPNSYALGLFRMQLGIYNLSGHDTTKWVNRALKQIGDEPVIYDPQLTSFSNQQLQLYMQNRGYLHAKTENVVDTLKKKAKVTYTITSNEPYRVRRYDVDFPDETLANIAKDTARTAIRPNMLFDVDVLEEERTRIASRFRRLGYYNFSKEFLTYEADTALNSHQVDLKIGLHDNIKESSEEITQLIFKRYTVRNVFFKVDAEFNPEAETTTIDVTDTLSHEGYRILAADEDFLRFKTLIRNTQIVPNTRYSDFLIERTYSSLNSLPSIKYVNINFRQVEDSLLDCNIHIAPAKAISFSTEAELTYTEGYWGLGASVSTQHRNVFKGAEMLSLQGRMAVEKQETLWAQEWGGQVGLLFPNFLVPFVPDDIKRRIRAKTEFTGMVNYLSRPQEYTMMNVGLGIKYLWNFMNFRHAFELIDLNYVYFPDISDNFRIRYIDSGTYNKYNYQNHLIMRIGYNGSRSYYSPSRPLRNYSTMRFNIETAGNLLYGLNSLFDGKKDESGYYNIFNIRFAQYAKGEFVLTRHQIFDKNNRFVYRAGVGIGVPYGNADVIPYERRFFSGGANSVRGWSESTLGPGIYQKLTPRGRRDYNQTGDIKLDLNMEYRTKLFWLMEGAAFLDAGNIWTIREYDEQPGGVFRFNSFMNQFAIAYGLGVRLDFSFFIFRFDVGAKLFDPNLGRHDSWRTKPNASDFAYHFAIGYPF